MCLLIRGAVISLRASLLFTVLNFFFHRTITVGLINSELANAVACVVLLTKVDDQQQIYLCLYLFPALCFLYFLSIASCAQTSESTWSNLSFQYSSNSSFGYQVSKMAVFSSSNLSKLFGISLVFLSKSPFKLNIEI